MQKYIFELMKLQIRLEINTINCMNYNFSVITRLDHHNPKWLCPDSHHFLFYHHLILFKRVHAYSTEVIFYCLTIAQLWKFAINMQVCLENYDHIQFCWKVFFNTKHKSTFTNHQFVDTVETLPL